MGRLFQWIRFAASPRGSHYRPAAPQRRRTLAFERCESRIALSAADGVLSEVVVDETERLLVSGDGGSITISFDASDFLSWSAVKNRFDGIALGRVTEYTIRTEPLVTLIQGSLDAATPAFVGDWEFAYSDDASFIGNGAVIDNAFASFDSTADGDYGMTLSQPELSSPSINSDLSVIPTPTPTPSELPDGGNVNEGGQIALTPFVAPTGLTLSDGYGSSAIARAKTNLEELGETPSASNGDANRLEGLRGRAVVYEVADAGGNQLPIDEASAEIEMPERDAVQLAPFNELAADDLNRDPQTAARLVVAANGVNSDCALPSEEQAPLVEATADQFQFAGELKLNGDEAFGSFGSMNSDPLAHDEALADWEPTGARDLQAEALAAPHDRDRRMLGAGLAAALSFMPLRKALRRRSQNGAQQELPRRRQML